MYIFSVPWVFAVLGGRVNLDENGVGMYHNRPKLAEEGKWNVYKTGVNAVGPSVRNSAKIMLLTMYVESVWPPIPLFV